VFRDLMVLMLDKAFKELKVEQEQMLVVDIGKKL
jgi:hypothetical protein